MAAPRKYSEELKERATRLALDARRDPASRVGAIKRIAEQLGIHPEALRTCLAATQDRVTRRRPSEPEHSDGRYPRSGRIVTRNPVVAASPGLRVVRPSRVAD